MDKTNKWEKESEALSSVDRLKKDEEKINEMIKNKFGESMTYYRLGELLAETIDLVHKKQINKNIVPHNNTPNFILSNIFYFKF